MATEVMINTITNLFNDYCPLGDSISLMSGFLIYTHGAQHFNHCCHLSATGPDDFANNQLGKIVEAISWNPSVTTFSDLSLRSGTNQEKEIGTRIIYVEKKLRHSEEYERLCQLMRDRYVMNGQAIVVIIGNDGFIDRKLKNSTVHLHVPPFKSHVPGFFLPKVKEEVKKVRDLIQNFWQEHLLTILDRYNTFLRISWLKNQDEQSWLPILAPSKAYSDLLHQPIYFAQMLDLAKKMVTSRRMEESAVPLEQKVLEATLAFIEEKNPMEQKSKFHPDDDFYYGPDMYEFIQKMLDRRDLRKEEISEILNDHDVVTRTWRPRFEVIDEEKSTEKKKVKKIIQPMCYAFDKEKLSNALKIYL